MDKMDVTIGISADASGVEAGVQRSKRSLADLGKSAKGVSDGLGSMGDGGAAAAKKIERDTRSMQNSIQRQIAVMQAGSKSSREYWDSLAGQRGISTSALKPYLDQLDQARKKADDAKQATIDFGEAMRFVQAAAAGGILMSVASQYMQLADAATNVNSRLKLVTNSTQELASAQAGLFAIAQKARVSYTDLVDTYAQMARSTKELGVSQRDMLGVTETISKAVTISGASAASAQAALIQLSQGFASGTLRGEELNSVMEQTPRLAMAIANGMGVSIGKLRELGQAGELTAEKVVQALQNSAGDVAREFDQMATTVEQAITKAENSLVRLIGVIDQTTGASGVAADGIGRFARGFDTLADSIQGMAASSSLSDFFTSAFQSNENLNAELKISEAEMAKLTARLAKAPDNIYVRSQIAELQKYIAGLKEAQARLAALTGASVPGGATDQRDQSQFISRGASYAKYAKQQEAARQGLLEISAKSNGITKQFTGDLKAYEEALRTGVISTNDYVKAVTELNQKRYESTEAGKAEAKAAKDGAKGNKEGESAILSYIKSLEARTAAQRLEIAQGDKLTESQRARIQLEALLADSKNKASKSQVANAQALLAESEANEAWLKNASDVEKALADMQKAREQSLQSVQDSVKKLVEEAEAAAYAETHNISLAEAVERLALARAENAYQQAVERQEAPATLAALEAELQARKKIVELTAQKGVKEANKKAAEQAAKDWEKVSQTIGDTLADYIMGGGKNAAQYLKRLFATLVLQPVVQGVVGGVFGTGTAQAGQVGGSSTMSAISSGQSLWSAFSGSLTAGIGGTIASLGTSFGASAATAFGSGIAAGGSLGLTAGLSQGASMLGAGAGSTAAGLGTMAGAVMPWVAGAMALYSLAKSFDKSGTPHTGAGAIYKDGQLQEGSAIYNRSNFGQGVPSEWSASGQTAVSSIAGALGGALDGFAKAFGQKAGYTVATAFADDSSSDGAWGSLRIADAVGTVLIDWERSRTSKWAPKIFADGDAGYKQYLAAVAVDVKQAFLAMDLPGWADEILATAKDIDTLSAAIQQIGTIKTVFDGLGQSMAMFKDLSGAAQTKLLQVSGSVDTLASNAQSFYANYYSEQERLDATVASLTATFAKYGAELPATAEQYRTLVEQQMAAGEAGAEFAAVLLGLNGTFKQVADVWERDIAQLSSEAAGFFDDLKSSIAGLRADLAGDKANLLRGSSVMSASEIARAISGTSVSQISVAQVSSAAAAKKAADAAVAAAEKSAAQAAAKSSTTGAAVLANAKALEGAREQAARELVATYLRHGNVQSGIRGEVVPASLQKYATYEATLSQMLGRISGVAGKDVIAFADQLAGLGTNSLSSKYGSTSTYKNELGQYQAAVNAEQANLARAAQLRTEASKLATEAAAAEKALAAARANQAKALKASEVAQQQYVQQAQKLAADAATGAAKLSDLRGEVLSFYEAQIQATQDMLGLIGSVRSATQSGLAGIQKPDTIGWAALNADVQAALGAAKATVKAGSSAGADSLNWLSALQGDVMSYYQQQKQVVEGLRASAQRLRDVVKDVQMSTLSSTDAAKAMLAEYAKNYSMALSTTGSARAAYADAMASQLPSLVEVVRNESATASQWRVQVAKLSAQASAIGTKLDADAAKATYEEQTVKLLTQIDASLLSLESRLSTDTSSQEQALSLLNQVDASLAKLQGATKSAEQVIADAINTGTASNLAGLKAVVAAIKGDPIPAFAAGGFHVGGLRLVGERGPELEATGPARIWTASQTAAMLGGGGSNAAVLAEIKALRDDNRRLGAENLRMQQRFTKLIERWEVEGMPSTRQEVVA